NEEMHEVLVLRNLRGDRRSEEGRAVGKRRVLTGTVIHDRPASNPDKQTKANEGRASALGVQGAAPSPAPPAFVSPATASAIPTPPRLPRIAALPNNSGRSRRNRSRSRSRARL